jgi:hypothetical protein
MSARSVSPWFVTALVMLVGLTAYTRLTAPWQFGLTNDEMHHLESWRNRYRTDDIYPLFLERVEAAGLLGEKNLERLKAAYAASPVVQRALIVLVDPQPPLFPVLAETIEAITHSNLVVARIPSALASIVAVLFMFRLGRLLWDASLGLWLASLLAIGLLAQMYATVARPYALAQCAVVIALYVFVRGMNEPRGSPARFLVAALFAQATQWMAWALMGPLALIEFGRRILGGARVWRMVRQWGWYAVLSGGLVSVMLVQLLNPTVSERAGMMSPLAIWYHISLASPFAMIDPVFGIGPKSPMSEDFSLGPVSAAGVLLLILMLVGVGACVGDGSIASNAPERSPRRALTVPAIRWSLVATLASSLLAQIAIGSGTRFMMTYIVLPTIFAGIGVHWLLRTRRTSEIVLVLVLAVFSTLRFVRPEDPFDRIFWGETDYAPIAQRLAEELGPEDVWVSYPYYQANCLYPFADLPRPVTPQSTPAFAEIVQSLPRSDRAVYYYGRQEAVDAFVTLRTSEERWDFQNGLVIVKIAPHPRGGTGKLPGEGTEGQRD